MCSPDAHYKWFQKPSSGNTFILNNEIKISSRFWQIQRNCCWKCIRIPQSSCLLHRIIGTQAFLVLNSGWQQLLGITDFFPPHPILAMIVVKEKYNFVSISLNLSITCLSVTLSLSVARKNVEFTLKIEKKGVSR